MSTIDLEPKLEAESPHTTESLLHESRFSQEQLEAADRIYTFINNDLYENAVIDIEGSTHKKLVYEISELTGFIDKHDICFILRAMMIEDMEYFGMSASESDESLKTINTGNHDMNRFGNVVGFIPKTVSKDEDPTKLLQDPTRPVYTLRGKICDESTLEVTVTDEGPIAHQLEKAERRNILTRYSIVDLIKLEIINSYEQL